MKYTLPALLVATLLACGPALAEDWPNWRGPGGMGHTRHADLPLTWGGKDNLNVLWKVPLLENPGVKPDHNQSSPVVRAGRVFVTLSYWTDPNAKHQYPAHHAPG